MKRMEQVSRGFTGFLFAYLRYVVYLFPPGGLAMAMICCKVLTVVDVVVVVFCIDLVSYAKMFPG